MPATHFKLNSDAGNAQIPSIGLGTWQSKPGQVTQAVETALKSGYRHIDGAFAYQNEKEVGQGVKNSGLDRKDIWLTSKLWCTYHNRAQEGIDATLKDLGTDYVDLLLVHWPVAMAQSKDLVPKNEDGSRALLKDWDPVIDTWKAMEDIHKSGKAKAIGVSNFSIPKLEKLLASAKIVPAVNQVELHPYLPQQELKAYCESKGILLQAYSPLGSSDSPLHKDEDVVKIAKKHNVEPANVLISYQVNRGVIVLPKSVTDSRIESNYKLIDLDEQDMKTLNGIHKSKGLKRFVKPDWGVPMQFEDWP